MKKIKKILALLLAMAMVMMMSVTAFAETKDNATIMVYNQDNTPLTNVNLQYLQVIEPDITSETGWKFSSDTIAADYITAFSPKDGDKVNAQTAIAMLIKYEYSTKQMSLPEGVPTIISGATSATATQINQALDNVMNGESFSDMANPQTVNKAGVYAIKATEVGYTYKAMAAYVGFGTVTVEGTEGSDNVTYDYPSLVDAKAVTKKIPTTVTKTDNDENNAVAIGQTVTYTITTAFPYFNQNDTSKIFKISDTITGAAYTGLVDDATTAEKKEKTATVQIGEIDVSSDVDFDQNENSFEIDLSDYIDNENSNAGKTVTVTYQAVINAVETENTASSHISNVKTDSNKVNLYTGKIKLTKVDAENNEVKLADAGFEVKKGDTVLTFTQKDANVKVYTYDPDGTATEVITDANGDVVVEGLDIGTYTFTEKTAPAGYSVNENPLNITLDIDDQGEADDDGNAIKIYEDADSIADTKLTALPSTGGIGTTIFTIAGCIIMILAAALFFFNRRRSAE